MYALPPYEVKHSGTVLILGSAPCLHDDFSQAAAHLDTFEIMAINEAAGFTRVQHIASMHPDQMHRFIELQLNLGAKREDFRTHSSDKITPHRRFEDYPVDHFWPGSHGGATSCWCAVRIARMLGYDELVLCGAPMNGGDGYYNDKETDPGNPASPRFGYMAAERGLVKSYKETLALYAKAEGDNVFSMSGYTREILGGPSWL